MLLKIYLMLQALGNTFVTLIVLVFEETSKSLDVSATLVKRYNARRYIWIKPSAPDRT